MASPSLSLSLTSAILFSLILISTTSSSDHQFELFDLHQPPQLSFPTTHHQPHPPSLSLTLHPRSSLHPATANYTALTLSRLTRDQARVHSLLLRHSLALSATSTSDLPPLEIQSPVTSGIRLGVGRPAKNFYMVLDSGSDVTWLQCRPCAACYNQSDPIFNPSASSTYRPLPCASPQCSTLDTSACRTNACLYQVDRK
ncbi:protein ASPARTIC PROTEASE IN GUARD CELL 1-like [Salvia splendens]|uniref:protein ASPARTIC PROTEASE IN GUARD CELL 1-like n=1 Tax=Salvia splendens TaxID=180675 RepID=UPI001C275E7C|nr:protein ASPARTIC PROTEASE IN GUARD CELL 1-like [Salvia splendens]